MAEETRDETQEKADTAATAPATPTRRIALVPTKLKPTCYRELPKPNKAYELVPKEGQVITKLDTAAVPQPFLDLDLLDAMRERLQKEK